MILAVVGSQGKHWTPRTKESAMHVIRAVLVVVEPTMVITGGEPTGVDQWVDDITLEREIPFEKFLPKFQSWEGYKARNILVAQGCDKLLRVHAKGALTYGSGWTADRAQDLGKKVWRVEI